MSSISKMLDIYTKNTNNLNLTTFLCMSNEYQTNIQSIQFKEVLSINIIGRTRFYTGLSIGFIILFGTFWSSILNIKNGVYINHYLSYEELILVFVHYFGITAYASGVVLLIWFMNRRQTVFPKRRHLGAGISQIIIYLLLFYSFIFNTRPFTYNPVELQQMYEMIGGPYINILKILAAPLLFYMNWNMIRLSMNCRTFRLINLAIGIAYAMLCSMLHWL